MSLQPACDDAGAMGVAIRGCDMSGLTSPTLDIGCDISGSRTGGESLGLE